MDFYDRYLTVKELMTLDESDLIVAVAKEIGDKIKSGDLRGCKMLPPLTTNGPIVSYLNAEFGDNADFMYYLQIEGTSNYMEEIKVIKPIVEEIEELMYDEDEFCGIHFDTGKELIDFNAITVSHEGKYVHMIVFLMKESEDCEDDEPSEEKYVC